MGRLALLVAGTLLSVSLAAQQPAPQPTPTPKASTPAPSAPVDPYIYRAEGRRDPFLSLVGAGGDASVASTRGEGPAGFTLGEISVRGVMQTRDQLVAMVQGPDNKTYLMHQGDKLADGVVKSVTPQGLIVIQDVSDPLSTQKQREVRKLLRSLEDTKE